VSDTVWLATYASVGGGHVEGVFATHDVAMQWLRAKRAEVVADEQRSWEFWQHEYRVGGERREETKRGEPRRRRTTRTDAEWDAHFDSLLAEPPVEVSEIEGDQFTRGDFDMYMIREWDVAVTQSSALDVEVSRQESREDNGQAGPPNGVAQPTARSEEAEKCESGCDAPVTHHDIEGTPLCTHCWNAMLDAAVPSGEGVDQRTETLE
jgi:hypothetical protein